MATRDGKSKEKLERADARMLRARLTAVALLVMERGFSHARIVREKSAEWNLSERSIWRYISRVEKEFAAAGKDDPGLTREKLREMLTAKIESAEGRGNYNAVMQGMALLAKSQGLLVDRVEGQVLHAHRHVHEMSPGEWQAELAAMSDEELRALQTYYAARQRRLETTPAVALLPAKKDEGA